MTEEDNSHEVDNVKLKFSDSLPSARVVKQSQNIQFSNRTFKITYSLN